MKEAVIIIIYNNNLIRHLKYYSFVADHSDSHNSSMDHQPHDNVAFEAEKGDGYGNISDTHKISNHELYQQNWKNLEKNPQVVHASDDHGNGWVGDTGEKRGTDRENGNLSNVNGVQVVPERVVDQKKEAEEFKKPLWYCRIIVSYPKTMFGK